jgi:spore germination protein GerM
VTKDRRGKNRRFSFAKFTVILIFAAAAGFFFFYCIDNPGFVKGLFNSERQEEEKDTSEEEPVIETEEAEATVAENIAVETYDGGKDREPSGEAAAFWQKITGFFTRGNGSSGETEEYPSSIDLDIYFAREGQEKVLAAEKRSIVAGSTGNALNNAMIELLKGPLMSYHFPLIPGGTELVGTRFKDGVAEVDLSSEFLENSLDTRILDQYIIYSIVNTVTGVPGVEGVVFFIEGKRISMYGNMDLSIPLIRNPEYIEIEHNAEG